MNADRQYKQIYSPQYNYFLKNSLLFSAKELDMTRYGIIRKSVIQNDYPV